ncbi:MAG: Gfo/Idh/MocA family oxidoreductase [Verrucomicrobia bacterium]|nr:Gfo/Idh/MocA family oxidoreductase [Verrucomicrobiota bacterium]
MSHDITRRSFLQTAAMAAASLPFATRSYAAVRGANDRVRVGIVGFSDRFKASLLPSFFDHAREMNFDIVALSDLWSKRREEGKAALEKAAGHEVAVFRNNDELYEKQKDLDAVIISSADFQHALHCAEACEAGKDVYCEKPLAETMSDARTVLRAVRKNKRVVQIGSQRRSGRNYIAAAEFIKQGKFGPIVNVDLIWNVNQPGRWRRPDVVPVCKQEDTDWKRFLLNRPFEPWDPRKYLEFRLFWPYSSGIPGQWMCHQIDTVNWFSGFNYPRSVVANGGIYMWKDGRTNADTLTAVFDYGPQEKEKGGFQVIFASRMTNSVGSVKEVYYSNGGMMDLDKGVVTPEGGLKEKEAAVMGMKPNLLPEVKLTDAVKIETSANTGKDPLTSAHMRNWMECIRSRKDPVAPIEAGFYHAVAVIMANAAYRTGLRVVYDPAKQEVLAGGKPFKY